MDKDKLNRRYKTLRWIQHISKWMGVAVCILPMFITSMKIAPKIENVESGLAFSSVGIFFTTVAALILVKGLAQQIASKIPPALAVFITTLILLIFVECLRKVLDEASAVLLAGVIGGFAGTLLGFVSIYCKGVADDMEIYYRKGKYDNV